MRPQDGDRDARPDWHREGSNNRAEHSDAADDKREDDPLQAVVRVDRNQGQTQDQRRDDGHLVAFKNIGCHPGTVTHIVTYQVSDNGCVTRVVLRDVLLDLAHQVSAYIGCLSINPTTNTHEEGDQRAAKTETQQGIRGCCPEDNEDNIESIDFDIDIAVKSDKYYQLVSRALQSEFKVDVLDLDSVHERIKKNIIQHGKMIYEKRKN